MRIYKDRYYIREVVPGISGFQRWNERERTIVTGHKARNYRLEIVGEYSPRSAGKYTLHDGHIHGHRPIVDGWENAAQFLAREPFQEVSEA